MTTSFSHLKNIGQFLPPVLFNMNASGKPSLNIEYGMHSVLRVLSLKFGRKYKIIGGLPGLSLLESMSVENFQIYSKFRQRQTETDKDRQKRL